MPLAVTCAMQGEIELWKDMSPQCKYCYANARDHLGFHHLGLTCNCRHAAGGVASKPEFEEGKMETGLIFFSGMLLPSFLSNNG